MRSNDERLTDFCAAETRLRCTARVNFHEHAPGAFSLVREHEKKVRPSGVTNGFGEFVIFYHSSDVQVLNGNQPVLIDDFARFFMMEISTLIADVIVKSTEQHNRFPSSVRSVLPTRNTPLQSPEFSLCGSEPTRILNSRSVAQSSECGKANINPDHAGIKGKRLGLVFDCEDSKPAPCLALNGKCFYRPMDRAVNLNPDLSDPRQTQLITEQRLSDLPKSNAVVSPCRTKPRIAWIVSASSSLKERLKSEIDSPKNVFQYVCVYARHVHALFSNSGELTILIKPSNRLTLKFPSITPLLESSIIKLAADRKLSVEDFFLALRGIDAVAKSLV